jgi:hypothetical protein
MYFWGKIFCKNFALQRLNQHFIWAASAIGLDVTLSYLGSVVGFSANTPLLSAMYGVVVPVGVYKIKTNSHIPKVRFTEIKLSEQIL